MEFSSQSFQSTGPCTICIIQPDDHSRFLVLFVKTEELQNNPHSRSLTSVLNDALREISSLDKMFSILWLYIISKETYI